MKQLFWISLALAFSACNPIGGDDVASPLARYSGSYSNTNETLLVAIYDNQFDLKCYPKTDADIKKFGISYSVELKGEITEIRFDTLSPRQIDTALVLRPISFFRINADNSTSPVDTLNLGGKSFESSPLLFNVHGDSSGTFSNYFGLSTVTK